MVRMGGGEIIPQPGTVNENVLESDFESYISTVIHICSVLCNMTINIVKFLNCSELI